MDSPIELTDVLRAFRYQFSSVYYIILYNSHGIRKLQSIVCVCGPPKTHKLHEILYHFNYTPLQQ